jgi:transposase
MPLFKVGESIPSLRENGKNKSGGQKGHQGETLKQTESPDIIKKHILVICPNCKHSLIQGCD